MLRWVSPPPSFRAQLAHVLDVNVAGNQLIERTYAVLDRDFAEQDVLRARLVVKRIQPGTSISTESIPLLCPSSKDGKNESGLPRLHFPNDSSDAAYLCAARLSVCRGCDTRGVHMTSATIKLFLPRGDAKSLRTAEISNWTGKAIAAPRTELDELLAREELDKAGVYILIGSDPQTNAPRAYIGEAEVIRERLKQHKTKEFWVSAIVFTSKDENLTKAHVRYLESRLLAEAARIGRFTLEQNQPAGSKLPESDREDMEVFLARIRQLLPVLGSDILTPIAQPPATAQPGGVLYCRVKGAEGRGQRTASGFVMFQGSTAVLEERPSAENYPYAIAQRRQLITDGVLSEKEGFLVLTRDAEFSSPSAAAAVIHGGSANGLSAWKTEDGKSLKQLDAQA